MIEGLSHIGVVVKNIETALQDFCRALAMPMPEIRNVPERQMRFAVIDVGGVGIELLEDSSTSGKLARHVQEKGEGIHHLCFVSDNIEGDMEEMKQRGFEFVSAKPRLGLRGKKIAFSTDDALSGFPFELSEP